MSELRQFRRLRIRKRKHEDPENEKFKRIVKNDQRISGFNIGYTAKVENSVVVAKIEKFSQKEFDRVRKILREAGYNSSFGVKNWKEGEKNVPGEEKEI